jgi:hypothetical protein
MQQSAFTILDFSNEKPSYAVMLQHEGFLALNKKDTSRKAKKKTQKKPTA